MTFSTEEILVGDPLDQFVTRDELADMFKVKTRSVDQWRGIPRVQIGPQVFYRRADVAEWLNRRIGRLERE